MALRHSLASVSISGGDARDLRANHHVVDGYATGLQTDSHHMIATINHMGVCDDVQIDRLVIRRHKSDQKARPADTLPIRRCFK
jgi:hypothetical protein